MSRSHHHHQSGHHYHNAYHHNHHSGFPLGAIVGGLALGTAAVATATVLSTPPPTYVVVESPEQIAERKERRRQAEEARRLENEARQAEIDRRKAETVRIRLENERMQDEHETARCANYQLHLQLIDEADNLTYDVLKPRITALGKLEEPISRFQNTPFKGLPESKMRNLFGCILFNQRALSQEHQCELITILLFNLGYSSHYLKLFQAPLLDPMLNNPKCFELLTNLYFNMYLQSHQHGIPLETERMIWCRLIAIDIANANKLFNLINTNERRYQLLTDWMNSGQIATDVIQTYNSIKTHFHLPDFALDGFYKIAKQQILKIELMNSNQPGMGLHPGENVDAIHNFLGTHRLLPPCFSVFFKPRSLRINHMIEDGHTAEATEAWGAESKKEEAFYRAVGIK